MNVKIAYKQVIKNIRIIDTSDSLLKHKQNNHHLFYLNTPSIIKNFIFNQYLFIYLMNLFIYKIICDNIFLNLNKFGIFVIFE